MKPIFRKMIKYAVRLISGLFVLITGYLLFAFILGLIPVNRAFEPAPDGITVYVLSNGLHTDLVLPVAAGGIDWREVIRTADFPADASRATYLSFGWGDRDFYLRTPTWADLKSGVTFRALLWPTPGAMHVAYLLSPPATDRRCRPLPLSHTQYRQLVTYIRASFREEDGRVRLIDAPGYTAYDRFYEARHAFTAVRTCNTWAAGGLRSAGVRTATWAPFEPAIFYQLRQLDTDSVGSRQSSVGSPLIDAPTAD